MGYAIGQSELIEGLERVKNSFNSYPLDKLAQAGAIAAIEDVAHLNTISQAVIQSREKLVQDLESLGFKTIPSSANFMFLGAAPMTHLPLKNAPSSITNLLVTISPLITAVFIILWSMGIS